MATKKDKTTKSKAVPKGSVSFLILMPEDLHYQLKVKAAKKRLLVRDCILDAMKMYCLYD